MHKIRTKLVILILTTMMIRMITTTLMSMMKNIKNMNTSINTITMIP